MIYFVDVAGEHVLLEGGAFQEVRRFDLGECRYEAAEGWAAAVFKAMNLAADGFCVLPIPERLLVWAARQGG